MDNRRHAPLLRTLAVAAVATLAAGAGPATATIVNGDFSDPTALAGWDVDGTVIGQPPGTEIAQLETDGSFLRTLSQTLVIPGAASELVFDFAFSTADDGSTSDPFVFPDSFAASLFTDPDGDFLDILVVDEAGPLPDPSDGIEGLTGALPIVVDLDDTVGLAGFVPLAGATTFSGHIRVALPAQVRGETATLFFDLFDEPDGAATIAAVDNVAVAALAVPAPAPGLLVLAGLASLGAARRRR